MVGVGIHQGGHCPHTPPPNANTAHRPQPSQIIEDRVNVTTLIIAQRNVLSFREATASEIEGEDCDVSAEQKVDDSGSILEKMYPYNLQLELPCR